MDVIANGDGDYTIKDVRGDLVIKATATAKMMAVTLDGEELSGADSVAYNKSYTFKLNRAAGYDYEISVMAADGSEVAYTMDKTGTTGTVKLSLIHISMHSLPDQYLRSGLHSRYSFRC